ncbi:MAG: hypothetical protein ACE5K0_09360 [Candidatus Methanofastidiosia archaeon]
MRCFIPRYRQLILCGDIPKEARYIKGVKLVETKEFKSLRDALKESLAEEEMGTPSVQIVYFNAEEGVFKNILRYLDRGWVATTASEKPALEKESFNIYEEIRFKEGIIYLLDPMLEDISIEERIIEDTRNRSSGVRFFMIQMKESQVHLAFQAIQDELEAGEKVTQSYLSETLGIREKTLKKIIEMGRRERRLDISNYIEETPPQVIKFLKDISSGKEISLAAVFDKKNLIGYARYRDIVFPTLNFLRLSDRVETFSDTKLNIGKRWSLRLNAKNKDIFIYKHNYLYGFILEKGINFIDITSRIEKLIESTK